MHGTHRGNASVLKSGWAGCTGKKRRKGESRACGKKIVAWDFHSRDRDREYRDFRPSRHGEQPLGGPPNSVRRPFRFRSCRRMKISAGSSPRSKPTVTLKSSFSPGTPALCMATGLKGRLDGVLETATMELDPVLASFLRSAFFRNNSSSLSSPSSSWSLSTAKAPASFCFLCFSITSHFRRASSAFLFSSSTRRSLASDSSFACCTSFSCSRWWFSSSSTVLVGIFSIFSASLDSSFSGFPVTGAITAGL
mmetsp:Transcript_38894/g.103320  ORF Transcript_38894/g.103320 Transcript_38894/m.103320 type:complete len:251 (+) Transcript_38894:136-888(+)